MGLSRRGAVAAIAAAFAVPVLLSSAVAQDAYPSQPIRIIVGFDPGGSTDTVARIMAPKMEELLGQSVIVENRPGAGSTIAAAYVAAAEPDGYTLFLSELGPSATAGNLYPDLPYDPATAFANVALIVTFPFVFAVAESSDVESIADLIQKARDNPGELNFSSAGRGTPSHLYPEQLNQMADLNTVHVPYQGGAPAVQAMVSGEVDYTVESISTALGQIQEGGLARALAVTSAEPIDLLPGVPPISTVMPGYEALNFHGLQAPAGTPDDVVAKLNAAVNEILAMPDVQKRFAEIAMIPSPGTPDEYSAFLKQNIDTWSALIGALDAGQQ
jgi:tripartite-type tricarboxylate transporter receptor subunit TctC